ncbi:fungal-specific transcription factor domain-domain-containing protein [Clohesyomyces aquaticus]|uniref:Fungal-specific transcription factor domain-domain-containing protein n=1 Tax=Clohesyomyces aquaticus TaxID=1231657 RepID=A0A1Y1ZZK5_9PLEO|nr:fungal-specific transcription factor domain-domain-containing protein [Clohesyomyces aquaticus]
MRSSIACARCRRSKVKCINNGVNTTCRACDTSGRECTYPAPAAGGAGGIARRESIIAGQHPGEGSSSQGETPRRPRPKKAIAPTSSSSYSNKESSRPLLDALDPQLLTPKIWTELFEIFQLHFSTDLPFLHPPTFLKPLRQSTLHSPPVDTSTAQSPSSSQPPASPLLLLAFLALTARFHPTLVAHHSPATSSRPSNPIVASEYYAAAARSRLTSPSGESLDMPTLERTQALLMMGLHDWGMCQGVKAWLSIGVAIRSAQILGLQFEQELDDMPLSRSVALNAEVDHMGVSPDRLGRSTMISKSDEFIEQEIRRRTFWSCFIMDRYLSSGKYRPSMLNTQDLRIQLPSSDRAFMFGEKVKTQLLGEDAEGVAHRADVQNQRKATVMLGTQNGDRERNEENGNGFYSNHDHQIRDSGDNARWEIGLDEGALSRFIKALDLYGSIVKWSCGGGRRRERYPPWDSRSSFHGLQNKLSAFKDSLPRDLTLSASNINAHIASRTSTPYTLMHTIHLLCSIMLHREYVPFIPLRCSKPQGPLDPPVFPPEEYQIPPGFWESSARECFKAARDLIDLLRTCQEWQVLVETPLVGFATYTVAFVGVYCINFPWMDPNGYMCKRQPAPMQAGYTTQPDSSGAEAARKALELVGQMRRRLHMANGWFKTIRRVHVYFSRMKKDFARNTRALEASSESGGSSSDSYKNLSLREGGVGGGLEEYKLLEKILKEFGSLEDEDLEMPDADGENVASRLGQGIEDGSESGSAAVKSENMDLLDGTPDSASIRHERWNAINSVAAAARTDTGSLPPVVPNGFQNHYGQQILSPTTHANSAPPPEGYSAPYIGPRTSNHQHLHAQPYPPNAAESAQRASVTLQQQLHHEITRGVPGPPSQPALWSPATKETWLNNIDTRFGGDDWAAFTAGNDWQEWAHSSKPDGWLTTVWTT